MTIWVFLQALKNNQNDFMKLAAKIRDLTAHDLRPSKWCSKISLGVAILQHLFAQFLNPVKNISRFSLC